MRRRRHSCRRAWPLAANAAALALLLLAAPAVAQGPPAEADPRCNPQVAEALAGSAQAGVEADLAVLRHPDQGIRNPDSILDFSCITDLFDYRSFDIHFDPAGALEQILDLARRRICAASPATPTAATSAVRLDPSVYTSDVRPASRPPSRPRRRLGTPQRDRRPERQRGRRACSATSSGVGNDSCRKARDAGGPAVRRGASDGRGRAALRGCCLELRS